jgi:integrase
MASIQKRSKNRYRARFRDSAGKEHARHFKRKIDAQRWLDEQTAGRVTGRYVAPDAGKVSFRDFAEGWRTAAAHAPTTREAVEAHLRNHVYPSIGDHRIDSITPTAVQAMATGWGAKLDPSTVRLVWSYVRSIFKAAVRDRIIAVSPCEGVRLPAVARREVSIPPLASLDILRANLPERFAAVVDLVAGAGLRPGEVFGLELDALDLEAGTVTVRQQLVSAGSATYLGPPKTAESARTVPLAPVTVEALRRHLKAFPPQPVTVEDRTDSRAPRSREVRLVFAREDRPANRMVWSRLWTPAARAAGLRARSGLHVLRHLYASLLIRHGENVKTVQHRLGHSSAVITLNTYAHLWPDADDTTRAAVTEGLINSAADSLRTR